MLRKYLYLFILLAIIIIAFLLRSKMLLHGDFFYLVDQARDMLLAKSIVVDHKLTLIGARTGLGGLFHGALWIYMITPFFFIAKGDPFFTLFPLFEIVNLGIIIIGFLVGKELYGKWMGILFALFLMLSSPLIETVVVTSNAQVLPSVVLLYLYAIISFIRGKDKSIILALFLIGIGFQFESAFAMLLIPLTVFAIIVGGKLPTLKSLALGVGAFVLAVSSFILFDLRHQFLMTSSALKLFTNHVKPLPGYEQYANMGFRFHDRLINLWDSLFAPLFVNNYITSFLLIAIVLASIILLIKNMIDARRVSLQHREYIFIILSPIIVYGVYVFYPLPLWPHYLLPITIFSVFILCIAIRSLWMNLYLKVLIGIFILLATVPAFTWIVDNYVVSPGFTTTSEGSYRNQLEVANWVISDARSNDYGYFVYSPGILTYNMDYLLWWQSRKNHLGVPSNFKHPVTYLIMYPHAAEDKDAYTFWKTHVVRTSGTIIFTKTFASRITVEKLHIANDEQPADPNYYQNLIFR